MSIDALIARFDVDDPAFIADPYPTLNALREATPIFRNERTGQWMLTRFADVYETLRDRRLGRSYSHLFTHAEVGRHHWRAVRMAHRDRNRLRGCGPQVAAMRHVEQPPQPTNQVPFAGFHQRKQFV